MIKIGVKLGADVPLFIKGENSYARGIGEKLIPKKSISGKFVVISPDIHSSTKEMFNLYDQQKNNKHIANTFAQNDFWQVFIEKNNQVSKFYKKYSRNFDICLSGTGSSMFIKYDDELEKEKIIKSRHAEVRILPPQPLIR